MTTPRELVKSTLEFRNASGIVPRHLWTLPWAETRYPLQLASMREEFPDDIAVLPASHMRYETPPPGAGTGTPKDATSTSGTASSRTYRPA
jgi:hypothetical protein